MNKSVSLLHEGNNLVENTIKLTIGIEADELLHFIDAWDAALHVFKIFFIDLYVGNQDNLGR